MDERYQRDEAKCILLGEIRYRDMDPLSKLYHIKCVTIVVYYSEKLTNYIMKSLSPGDRDTRGGVPFFWQKGRVPATPASTLYTLIKCGFYYATPWEITTGMRLKLLLLDYPLSSGDPVICCVDQASLFFFLSVGSCPSLPHSRRARVSNKQSNSRLISFLQL